MVPPATTLLSFCTVYFLMSQPYFFTLLSIRNHIAKCRQHTQSHNQVNIWVLFSSMIPSIWGLKLTHPDQVQIIFGLLSCLLHVMFTFPPYCPLIWAYKLFTPALSCCGSVIKFFPLAVYSGILELYSIYLHFLYQHSY